MFEELRKKSKLTQMELAQKLKVKQNTISNWENGKAKPDIKRQLRGLFGNGKTRLRHGKYIGNG